jgi:hypothetical protein
VSLLARHRPPRLIYPASIEHNLKQPELDFYIKRIDAALAVCNKQWVFIFDQVNKLFANPLNRYAKDTSGLQFPFYMISSVTTTGRITSIIAASANNEISYKDRHEGFYEYNHCTTMIADELMMAFDCINK